MLAPYHGYFKFAVLDRRHLRVTLILSQLTSAPPLEQTWKLYECWEKTCWVLAKRRLVQHLHCSSILEIHLTAVAVYLVDEKRERKRFKCHQSTPVCMTSNLTGHIFVMRCPLDLIPSSTASRAGVSSPAAAILLRGIKAIAAASPLEAAATAEGAPLSQLVEDVIFTPDGRYTACWCLYCFAAP